MLMRKMFLQRKLMFLSASLIFIAFHVRAQQTINAVLNDNISLNADSFQGTLQWQNSPNGENWTDIPGATTSPYQHKLSSLPMYFRAKVLEEHCDPHFSEIIFVQVNEVNNVKLWSNPATWNGAKPQAGENVIIPAATHIVLDENPPALGSITILGTLEFMRKDLALTSKWIMVHGTLQIGTHAEPFTHNAIITLNGANTNEDIMGMGTRGIMVMGGTLELHGVSPAVAWTKINQHAPAGSTSVELMEPVTWKVGDEIVVGPTDYYEASNGNSVTQRLSLTSVNGLTLAFNGGLNAHRWGRLQYATVNGMSLTSNNLVTPPVADTETTKTPLVLDERAPIGNVTRNIVIQAPADAAWTSFGFGAHVMIMGPTSTAHVEGVEIRRGGQRGKLARYPFHWHMLSYNGSNTLPDATGQYFRNSSINTSANRGIVIHGTNGVLVQNNIVFDVRGHGIFTEDAVERRNTIDKNLVLHVRNSSQPLKQHETGDRGSAAFWINNPDNTITNNTGADCRSSGFWLAFPEQPWGLSTSVLHTDGLLLNPSRLPFGVFDNNTAHSCRYEGIMLDNVEIDQQGNTYPFQYTSTTNGRTPTWNSGTRKRFSLSRYKVWKNGSNGIWDRAVWPDNFETVSADNCGRFFAGSGSDGIIERSLVVGTSLNHLMNGTDRPQFVESTGGTQAPTAFATYHSTFDIRHNIIINFPLVENTRSGAFATEDYYTRGVDKGQIRNVNNLLIQSHPGVKVQAIFNYFNLALALWDPHGSWGPAQNYFVYNTPFLTHGLAVNSVAPGSSAGGVSVPGPFYGFNAFVLHGVGDDLPQNQPWNDLWAIQVRRYDQSLNEVGTWTVNAAQQNDLLQHMRSFAGHPSGIYTVNFPGATHPTHFQMDVENMLTTDDLLVVGIQFDGTINARVRMRAYTTFFQNYQAVNSLAEVRASSGATYWQDKPNNMMWMKLRGGFWQFWTNNAAEALPTSDELLYEPMYVEILPH